MADGAFCALRLMVHYTGNVHKVILPTKVIDYGLRQFCTCCGSVVWSRLFPERRMSADFGRKVE